MSKSSARSPDRHRNMHILALCGAGTLIIALTALAPYLFDGANWSPFIVIMIASGFVTIAATLAAIRVPERTGLLIIVGVAVVLRAIALLPEPLLSSDIYRYVWDGRVQAAGINPYRYIPADPALAALRDTAVYPNINRADYAHTAYPPVAEYFFFAATRLGDSVLAMRIAFIGCEIAIVFMLLNILRMLARPMTWVVAYLWHPLAVWEIANAGHVDGLLATLVTAAVWLLLRGKRVYGAATVALAILVKPYAAVILPVFWKPWDWRAPTIVLAVIAICYLPYLGVGSAVFGFIPGYLKEEGLHGGAGFWLVRLANLAFSDLALLRGAYFGLALVTFGALAFWIAYRSRPSDPQRQIRDIVLLLMAGLFFLSPNYPWYYLALVPVIPLGAGAPAWVLTISGITLHLFWPENYDVRIILWKSIINAGFLIALFVDYTAVGQRLFRARGEMNSRDKGM